MQNTTVPFIAKSLTLAEKLESLYGLRTGEGRITTGFRPDYLTLLHNLDDPQLHLPPVIHVAGTNGKGSTIAFLRSMLTAAGYRVHVYTSPHLIKFNERIVVADADISDDALESLIDEVSALNNGAPITFFEFVTAMAFTAFTRTKADIVLLETGLGGRLDCTNVIPAPLACLITPISYDHMEFLGNTLEAIAREKAGIIKNGSLCITGPQDKSVRDVLKTKATALDSKLYCHSDFWDARSHGSLMTLRLGPDEFTYPQPNLIGPHQIINAGMTITCLKLQSQFKVDEAHIIEGLNNAYWPARLEHIKSGPLYQALPASYDIWYDGGHNEAGALTIAAQAAIWQRTDHKPLHLIVAMNRTKDPCAFIKHLAPYATTITIAEYDDFYTYDEIRPLLENTVSCPISKYETPTKFAENRCKSRDGRILLCGSLYFNNMKNIL